MTVGVQIFCNVKRPVKVRYRARIPAVESRGAKEFYGPSAKSVKKKAFRWLKQQQNLRKGMQAGETLHSIHEWNEDA